VAVTEPGLAVGRDLGQHHPGAVPREGAVRLRRVGRDAEGGCGDALDHRACIAHRGFPHTSSRTVSDAMVSAILPPAGVPRASDSARWAACLSVALGGIGGSFWSTTASISTGPGVASAARKASPHCAGSSIVKACTPKPRAMAAKSIGCRSQTYSGLPRKTICSHLIWPSELFLITTILTSSLYF